MKILELPKGRIELYDNTETYAILEKTTRVLHGRLIEDKIWSSGELICIDTKKEYRQNEKPVYVNKIRGQKAKLSRYSGDTYNVKFVVINIKTREIIFEDEWKSKKELT